MSQIRHGHAKAFNLSPIYQIWLNMRQRCQNSKNSHYAEYGGRGITVCERWEVFENFLSDMGEKPDGMTIDRRDNDGNYEPSNCRWATRKQQSRNHRRNRYITAFGETLLITDAAEKYGIKLQTLIGRLKQPELFTVEQALTTKRFGRRSGKHGNLHLEKKK